MSIIKAYKTIKDVLNDEYIEKKIIEDNMEYLISVMECWLDRCEFDKEFEALIHLIKDDYSYTGKLYRGITLLKNTKPLKDRLDCSFSQSFSMNKEIAIRFAENNKVTVNDEINVIKADYEITPVMIELDIVESGVNLFKFCKDLVEICDVCIDEDLAEDFKQTLSYAIDEEEILMLPYMMKSYFDSANIYSI